MGQSSGFLTIPYGVFDDIASAGSGLFGGIKLDQATFGHRWTLAAASIQVQTAFTATSGADTTTIKVGYLPTAAAASTAFVSLGSAVTKPTACAANATGTISLRGGAVITVSKPNTVIPDDAVLAIRYSNGDADKVSIKGLHGVIVLKPA